MRNPYKAGHYVAIPVSADYFVTQFTESQYPHRCVANGLPNGTEFEGCLLDTEHYGSRDVYNFVFSHPSFPLVLRNEKLPTFSPIFVDEVTRYPVGALST